MDLTSYRWDSILKISELAELCSDGNRVIQRQMLDTLSRYPSGQIHTLTKPIGNSKVLLCEGVHFLNQEGYNLPEWIKKFGIENPDLCLNTNNFPTPRIPNKGSKQKKPHHLFWAEIQKQNPNATGNEVMKIIEGLLRGGASQAKSEAEKHFGLYQNSLTLKGKTSTPAPGTIADWNSIANKTWRN